jgi:hypothetical protein
MHIEDKDAYGRLTTQHTVLQSPYSLILRCGGCGARHNRWLDLSGAVRMASQTTSRQNLNGLTLGHGTFHGNGRVATDRRGVGSGHLFVRSTPSKPSDLGTQQPTSRSGTFILSWRTASDNTLSLSHCDRDLFSREANAEILEM